VERDPERLRAAEKTVGESSSEGREVLGLRLDVSSEADMEMMAARALEAFGAIDVLVTSAGILRAAGTGLKQLVDTEPEEFDQVVDVNLRGTFLATRAVLPAMLRARKGQIVHISSLSGLQGRAFDGPYCASKFAVRGFSEALAEEVRPAGIRVHTLFLDAVATPMWEQNGPVPMPADALPPERVAELIASLVELPGDCVLVNPVLKPFAGRRQRKRGKGPGS
jgi:NAD(P)-dependent dehydrogenase (short-subunit alcohol dehydrogenase family)